MASFEPPSTVLAMSRQRKGKISSADEKKQLARSFLHVSQDAHVGNN